MVEKSMGTVKLYIGSGKDRLAGFTRLDVDESVKPDVVCPAWKLPYESGTVTEIECRHLFEHLTLFEAKKTLQEWVRVLKPDGRLNLELPNLARSMEMIQSGKTEEVFYGFVGIYGWPDAIKGFAGYNQFQQHKWGWTPETLTDLMTTYGFKDIEEEPVKQVNRKASKYNRDMRLTGVKK